MYKFVYFPKYRTKTRYENSLNRQNYLHHLPIPYRRSKLFKLTLKYRYQYFPPAFFLTRFIMVTRWPDVELLTTRAQQNLRTVRVWIIGSSLKYYSQERIPYIRLNPSLLLVPANQGE